MRLLSRSLSSALFLCAWLQFSFSADVPQDWPGLIVVLPAVDAVQIARWTAGGRTLVHGLVRDDSELRRMRGELQALGVYGAASVVMPQAVSKLPYADNLVNRIYCDQDLLKAEAPAEAEILRVLVPEGSAFVRSNGQVKRIDKPRPSGIDNWTHFDYDAAGSGVSHDTLVQPPNQAQWWMEVEPYSGLGDNPAKYRPYSGFRISGGRAFFVLNEGKEGDSRPPTFLVARDAFNGLPLWKVKYASPGYGTPQEYQFAVNRDRVFTFLDHDTYAVALNSETGKIETTFDHGAQWSDKKNRNPAYLMLRATDSTLVEAAEEKLYAFDAHTGATKWVYEEKSGGWVSFPRIVEAENRVLVQVAESKASRIQGRWANLETTALLCLELNSGRELWRSTAIDGMSIGQTIECGDGIYGFTPAGIGASDKSFKEPHGQVVKLNASDGSLQWKSPGFNWGYNLLVRDGKPFFATPDALNSVQPADGSVSTFWKARFNNRCNRTSATGAWIIMGMGNFVDKSGVATVKGISRGGCAQGVVPADGLLFYTPNICHCITMLRGHLALSAEPVQPSLPDDRRLQQSGAVPTSAQFKSPAFESPLASEWPKQVAYGALESPTVAVAGGSYLVAVIHEHRVELRDQAGKNVWSVTVGGRVSQPPITEGDAVYFGSHDGSLYCVGLADGNLRWRFFAAPSERYFIGHGQVESSWPVYNAMLYQGLVCCSAGLHSETGGGIYAWGLDPKSGAIRWHKHLARSELTVKPSGKIAPNRVMNSPLISLDGKLSITGLSFSPDEPDASIQQRIDFDSMGDKNRNFGWSLRGPLPGKNGKGK